MLSKISIWTAIFLTCLVLLSTGCGSSGSPLSPTHPDQNSYKNLDPLASGHFVGTTPRMLMGAYRLILKDAGLFEILPLRGAEAHYDITKLLFPPKCYDCFKVVLVSMQGNTWNFKITLRNSTPVTGYDVRGTILDMGNVLLESTSDSFTEMFAGPGDLSPRNPFFIFDSGQDKNKWPPMATGYRELTFTKPDGAKFAEVDFVIDASWPGNQGDPTVISQLKLSNTILYTEGSSFTNLTCQISDWQDDITSVTVDLSPLGGSSSVNLSQAVNGTWFLNGIICDPSCEVGPKTLWVTASSGGLSIYNFTECTVETPLPPGPAEWTFMVYLHAANLPDEEDINEMEMSGSVPGKLNIIVLWDKPEPTDTDVIVKVEYDANGYNLDLVSTIVDDQGAVIPAGGLDMGDGNTLTAFMLWTVEKYPAKHYLLDLWDHGSGIFGGPEPRIPFREVCGGLNLWEIRDSCKAALATQTLTDKIDIIGFDACVMGWIETAYSLRDVTDIVIASENSEPGPGWDYGPPLINLKENIDTYTAEKLARDISEYYIISYTDPTHPYHYVCDNVTQAACRISTLLDLVVPALNAFVTEAINCLPEYKPQFDECLAETSYWGWGVTDIGHFAWAVTQNPGLPSSLKDKAQDLRDAVEHAMIYHGHNAGVPDQESGWTIWFPSDITLENAVYQTEYLEPGYIEFYETQWDEFLYAYAGQVQVVKGWLEIDNTTFSDVAGGDGDGVIEPDETIDITLGIHNTGTENATNVFGQISCEAGYDSIFQVVDSNATFPDVLPDQIVTNPTPFRIHIDPACPSGAVALARVGLFCDQSESHNLPVSFVVNPSEILIIDLDPDAASAPEIKTAIEANGHTADITHADIHDAPFTSYKAVFITLGMYDDLAINYVPDYDDLDAILAYLQTGASVYMESGDLWAYYAYPGGPDYCATFSITGLSDGGEDITSLQGQPGTLTDGQLLTYPGNDYYADHIDATAGGQVVFTSDNGVDPAYGVMVTADQGTYKTIGASIEFGGIGDDASPNTKAELMSRILQFFGL
jgi:hypothetical protein